MTQAMMVDQTMAQDYKEPIPINPMYKAAFMAVYQHSKAKSMNIHVVHGTTGDAAEKGSLQDVGIFDAKFGDWSCTLNWTQDKRANLPPDYIGVDYGSTSCGIIGPHLTVRTCWNCGQSGFRDQARKEGVCSASHYEEDGLWIANFCPHCHDSDWWARMIEPSRFIRDCAEAIARRTNRPKLWTSFGGDQMDENIRAA